jgi:SAM-dependent methyltransferase
MRWIAKALIQDALSVLPNADAANLFFQSRVTRGLPRDEAGFIQHAHEAIKHVDSLSRQTTTELGRARLYEFGAGWDLIGPLTAYCAGAGSQTLVDIRPNLRIELVNHTIAQLRTHRARLESEIGRAIRDPGEADVGSVAELERRFGIRYLAPCDARRTGLEGGCFDLISSTFTMEHIPAADLEAILIESARLLTPEGVISCSIDMKDHYSYFDAGLSAYNFLRFSPRRWRLVNPSLHFQNRLRHRDYVTLFEAAGLRIISEQTLWGDRDDLETVDKLPPWRDFSRRYSLEELAAREMTVIASKSE